MYPKHIKKLQEIFGIPDEAVIQIKVGEGEPRVCDYCNNILIDGEGKVLEKTHLTDYGLVCDKCLKTIEPAVTYLPGENVSGERWYQQGIER